MTLAPSDALSTQGLIHWADPHQPFDRSVLDSAGGFVWWYCDHVDEQGNGFVCIWSFGLPFLPDLLSEAREGRPVPPRRRPSVNLALYERGKPVFYLLQEYPEQAARWSDNEVRLGASRFTTARRDGRVQMVIFPKDEEDTSDDASPAETPEDTTPETDG